MAERVAEDPARLPAGLTYHKSVGVLRHAHADGYKLILEADQAISDYYRALLPRYIQPNPQRYGAHISVVRHEVPVVLAAWGRREGERVEFQYSTRVFFGTVYCWLNVFCTRLEEVRTELGLPVSSPYTQPPEGFAKCFHLTLGNFKA